MGYGPGRRSVVTQRATKRQNRLNGQRGTLGGSIGYGALVDFRGPPRGQGLANPDQLQRSGLGGAMGYGVHEPRSQVIGGPRGSKIGSMGKGALTAVQWDTETETTFSGRRRAAKGQYRLNEERDVFGGAMAYRARNDGRWLPRGPRSGNT